MRKATEFLLKVFCNHDWFIGAKRAHLVKVGKTTKLITDEQCVLCKKCGKTIYAEIKSASYTRKVKA